MTDDDIAAMIAVDFGVPPTPDVLDEIKRTRHFRSVKARMAMSELRVSVERNAPRWLRRLFDWGDR